MNNEIREKDHEWVKMFHSNIDWKTQARMTPGARLI